MAATLSVTINGNAFLTKSILSVDKKTSLQNSFAPSPISVKSNVSLKAKSRQFPVFAASDDSTEGADEDTDDIAVSDVEVLNEDEIEKAIKDVQGFVTGSTELKQGLLDTVDGTERGLKASSEVRAEIAELIGQLEAINPTTAPTEAVELLDGKWILAYTSFSELYALLAVGNLPLVTVGEISQTIDASAGTLANEITFLNPLAKSTVKTEASFEVRSAKRIQVKFQETVLSPPQSVDNLEVPSSIELFGRKIDVPNAEGILSSVREASETVLRTLSGQPPLKVPINSDKASSWLLTTYLDDDLRIARGDGGGVFVLVKEGSLLLASLSS